MSPSDALRSTPRVVRLLVTRTHIALASKAITASTVFARMMGLLNRQGLEDGEALILPRCQSIHTIGMRFPIDVAFVDREWRVVGLFAPLVPWRMVGPVWNAWSAVELPAGSLRRAGVVVGDRLQVS